MAKGSKKKNVPLLGRPEFPTRNAISIRSLSPAIVAAKPAGIKEWRPLKERQEKHMKLQQWNINADGLNFTDLKDVVRDVETHLQSISGLQRNMVYDSIVDSDSLTAYADYYNIFYLDSPAIGALYWRIKAAFHEYVEIYGLQVTQPLFIHSWFNCVRHKANLSAHAHGLHVAGNLGINIPPGSFTRYDSLDPDVEHELENARRACASGQPLCTSSGKQCKRVCSEVDVIFSETIQGWKAVKEHDLPNSEGQLTMFLGSVTHQTSSITDSMWKHLQGQRHDCRMTAAFDIKAHPVNAWHTVPFYSPADPWWEKDTTGDLGNRVGQALENVFEGLQIPPLFEWEVLPDRSAFHERLQDFLKDKQRRLREWEDEGFQEGWFYNQKKPQPGVPELKVIFHNAHPTDSVRLIWRPPWALKERGTLHASERGIISPGSSASFSSFPGETWESWQIESDILIKKVVTTRDAEQNHEMSVDKLQNAKNAEL